MTALDEKTLRAYAEKRIGQLIPDPVWLLFAERGLIGDVLNAYDDEEKRDALRYLIRELSREMRMLRALQQQDDFSARVGSVAAKSVSKNHSMETRTPDSAPLAAIAQALMAEACAPAAAEFRARWCGGKTLHPEEVEAWLQSHASAPFEPVKLTSENVDVILWRGRAYFAEQARVTMERRRALHELKQLVEDISQRFCCAMEDAVLFALCGQAPPIGVRVKRRWTLPFGVPHLIMEIPVWLEPSEVERLYRQARKDWGLVKRFRFPSPRLARVVRELVSGRQRGETFAETAKRLGMSRNQLVDKWHRARKIAIRILTGTKGGKSREGGET